MITVDGHTFDETRPRDGWTIDAGCRGWNFTNALFSDNWNPFVYALDIEDFSRENHYHKKRVKFRHAGLAAERGLVNAYYFGNGTGNFVAGINEVPYNGPDRPCETKQVELITLDDIYAEIGTDIEILKLDIEGSEYDLLINMKHAYPAQITVEFHEHCHTDLHNRLMPKVIERMARDYKMQTFIQEQRYPYLDVLFTRKDL